MHIIGISGKPGSQKLVYGFKLYQEFWFHGHPTEMVSLAAPLYHEFNGIADELKSGAPTDELIEKWALGERGEELVELLSQDIGPRYDFGYHRRNEFVRRGLTLLGSAIRRQQDPDYFVRQLLQSTADSSSTFGILTDLRYPNEAQALEETDGLTLRVEVVKDWQEGGYKYEAGLQDPSETALDEYLGFYSHLIPSVFNRVEFAIEILAYYGLPMREEVIR